MMLGMEKILDDGMLLEVQLHLMTTVMLRDGVLHNTDCPEGLARHQPTRAFLRHTVGFDCFAGFADDALAQLAEFDAFRRSGIKPFKHHIVGSVQHRRDLL